jgi:anti-anti-sigma factor
MALSFKQKVFNSCPVLIIDGRIVDSDSDKFAKKIEALCSGGQPRVAIDLTGVEFLDSFGLAILVRFHLAVQRAQRELVFIYMNPNPHAFLWRLFEMTGLRNVLKIIDGPEQL